MLKRLTEAQAIIWAAIITGAFLIVIAVYQAHPWLKNNKTLQSTIYRGLSGTVIDAQSSKSIELAEITVVGKNYKYYSETNGNFHIDFSDSLSHVRIIVKKANYKIYDMSYDVPTDDIIIPLEKTK